MSMGVGVFVFCILAVKSHLTVLGPGSKQILGIKVLVFGYYNPYILIAFSASFQSSLIRHRNA